SVLMAAGVMSGVPTICSWVSVFCTVERPFTPITIDATPKQINKIAAMKPPSSNTLRMTFSLSRVSETDLPQASSTRGGAPSGFGLTQRAAILSGVRGITAIAMASAARSGSVALHARFGQRTRIEQRGGILGRQWPAEAIALSQRASHPAQQGGLGTGFDALGDGVHADGVGHVDHGLDEH